MERNDDKIIQQKMREAEEAPILWDKERVWSSINKNKSSKGRELIFYYAAASLLLASMLVFYTIRFVQRKKLEEQIRAIELAVEKRVQQIKPAEVEECQTAAVEPSSETEFHYRILKSNRIVLPDKITPDQKLQSEEISDSTAQLLSQQPASLPILAEHGQVTEIPATIEPIIGVYIPKKESQISRRERKVHIRLLSSQEVKSPEEIAPFVLARIK